MKHRLMMACVALTVAGVGTAYAQSGMSNMSGMQSMKRAESVLCPTAVSVVLTPKPAAAGWSTNNSPVALSPDAKNPPRVESGELICYYAMPDGYNAFVYFQSLGGRTCTVNSAKTGFECH